MSSLVTHTLAALRKVLYRLHNNTHWRLLGKYSIDCSNYSGFHLTCFLTDYPNNAHTAFTSVRSTESNCNSSGMLLPRSISTWQPFLPCMTAISDNGLEEVFLQVIDSSDVHQRVSVNCMTSAMYYYSSRVHIAHRFYHQS